MNRQFGMLFNFAHLVHPLRELAAGSNIGENDIPCVGKKGLRKLISFTRIPGNMEFHHKRSLAPELFLPTDEPAPRLRKIPSGLPSQILLPQHRSIPAKTQRASTR